MTTTLTYLLADLAQKGGRGLKEDIEDSADILGHSTSHDLLVKGYNLKILVAGD